MSAHFLLISAASGCTVTVADSLYGTVRYDMSVTGIRLALALHCVALPCVALPYEYNRGSEAPRFFWAQVMVIIKGPHLDNPTSDIDVHPPHDKALPIQHTSLATATTYGWTPSILDGRSYNCQLPAAVRAMDAVVTFRWCVPPCGATCMQVMGIPPSWIRHLSRCD
jgi:hypothetical protein